MVKGCKVGILGSCQLPCDPGRALNPLCVSAISAVNNFPLRVVTRIRWVNTNKVLSTVAGAWGVPGACWLLLLLSLSLLVLAQGIEWLKTHPASEESKERMLALFSPEFPFLFCHHTRLITETPTCM